MVRARTKFIIGGVLVLGTAGYMAPEQVEGKAADSRSDIFSLGVVLYQLLTRRSPFGRETAAATIYAIVHDTPERIGSLRKDVPTQLERVIERTIAKAPDSRFQAIEDLRID